MFGSKQSKVEKAIAKKNAAALVSMAADKDESVMMAAIAGLGKVKGDDAYNALISMLRHTNAKVRIAAARALGDMDDPKARAHIEHMMDTEKDETVKTELRKAVAMLHTNE